LPRWRIHVVSVVYFVMFATLFLENGLLPASFLPGDSLLIAGWRADRSGRDDFTYHSYSDCRRQPGLLAELHSGRWLGNTRTVKGWLAQLPEKYHQRATCMFDRTV
jgi:membrane protein DedA with SNARE-associated domain